MASGIESKMENIATEFQSANHRETLSTFQLNSSFDTLKFSTLRNGYSNYGAIPMVGFTVDDDSSIAIMGGSGTIVGR